MSRRSITSGHRTLHKNIIRMPWFVKYFLVCGDLGGLVCSCHAPGLHSVADGNSKLRHLLSDLPNSILRFRIHCDHRS